MDMWKNRTAKACKACFPVLTYSLNVRGGAILMCMALVGQMSLKIHQDIRWYYSLLALLVVLLVSCLSNEITHHLNN